MHILVLKFVIPNSNYGQSKKGLKMVKYPFVAWSLWYVKTDPSQNQDSSTSLGRPYKELLNAFFSLEIRYP